MTFMGSKNKGVRGAMLGLLMATTALGTGFLAEPARAQISRSYDIPAGPLPQALNRFAEQAGLELFYSSELTQGRRTEGLGGEYAPAEALSRLLAGTGLTFRQTGANGFTLEPAPQSSSGAIQLGTIRVEGSGDVTTVEVVGQRGVGAGFTEDSVYAQAGAVSHISAERIARFRGSSPADIFRGTPGVLSGEARNGAGSIDVNIRGLQGFGRVATTIDGAENAVTVYQGYQGVSNRTYVDPDFIAGVDITKGSDATSFGNAGSVAIRTLNAGDIVETGEKWGLRLKTGFRDNTSRPQAGSLGGYQFVRNKIATPSPSGLDRPGALTPTSISNSLVGAFKGETVELLAGYAWRKQGNFHAGEHGPVAAPYDAGGTSAFLANAGLANYRAGEEVLNTELKTESWLTKLTAHFGDGQTLQAGYTRYESEAGDRLASRQTSNTGQAQQQKQTAGTKLDTFTTRYRWNPQDNALIDLKANAYWSHLELRNTIRGGRAVTPDDIGLSEDFRVGSDSDLWGLEISNRSKLDLSGGALDLDYGLSYRGEDTRGSLYSSELEAWNTPRDGLRHEIAAFTKAGWKPLDWLTLNAGLRYSWFRSKDRVDPFEADNQVPNERVILGFRNSGGGFSPSVGVTLEPFTGTQIYVNYSDTLRAPSVTETVSAFNSFVANAQVRPERSRNWEVGANYRREGLFTDTDRSLSKLSYFNWDIKNYISRYVRTNAPGEAYFLSLNIENIDKARFEGLEFSTRYQTGGFTADFAANYFLDVEFCRTADACGSKSLYGDYATNHVPPEYTLDLTLAQKLFNERLTFGGRVTHTGSRAIGHGDVTAQGAGQFIALVDWEAYTLVDAFVDYKLTDGLTVSLRGENLTDRFYLDPLGLVTQPGPGRTLSAHLTASIGGHHSLSWLPGFETGAITRDWSGFYAGVHGGGNAFSTKGTTTAIIGDNPNAALESADEEGLSGLFGVQAGYNHQFGNGVVIGLEADYGRTWLHEYAKLLSVNETLANKGFRETVTHYDIDWTASLRARLGYAFNEQWLVYGTAGLAQAHETQWRDQYVSDSAWSSAPLGGSTNLLFVEKVAHTRNGYTYGLGTEYALSDRWSIRAEYNYSRFRRKNFDFTDARAGTGKDYRTSQIVGWEPAPPPFAPGSPICAIPGFEWACEPGQKAIYEYTDHTGTSNIVEGRRAANKLELHALKFGLNFRF